ncbi:MAG: GGDEF domain-containing protein [Bacillota bacterium]
MGFTMNLVALEVLAINLFTTYQCSRKRFSVVKTWTLFVAFTLLMMGLNQFVFHPFLPEPFNGEGLYLVLGLLYFIPLVIAYDQPYERTALIMFTTWIYTTMIYAVARRMAELWIAEAPYYVLVLQTVLFLISFAFFFAFIKKKFMYVVEYADSKTTTITVWLSVLWFSVVWLLNLDFYYSSFAIDFMIMMLLGVSILLSYIVFNALAQAETIKDTMAKLSLHDELTGLRNREALRKDMQGLLQKGAPFSVIFMDLDRFKSVNDDYGHAKGDAYLKMFAQVVEGRYKDAASVYRMSGDEFVMILPEADESKVCNDIETLRFDEEAFEPPFLGVSVGCAHYPKDAEELSELLHIADTNMYQIKKRRHADQGASLLKKDDENEYAT